MEQLKPQGTELAEIVKQMVAETYQKEDDLLMAKFVNPNLVEGAIEISKEYFKLAGALVTKAPASLCRSLALQSIVKAKNEHIIEFIKNSPKIS